MVLRKATGRRPSKYVICTYHSYERVCDVYLKLEHAAVSKSFGPLIKRYYGITKDVVAWLLARCIPCQESVSMTPFDCRIRN